MLFQKAEAQCSVFRVYALNKLVLIGVRVHLFPYRTQKLSSFPPKILVGWLTGKIGNANTIKLRPKGWGFFAAWNSPPDCFLTPRKYLFLTGKIGNANTKRNIPPECSVFSFPYNNDAFCSLRWRENTCPNRETGNANTEKPLAKASGFFAAWNMPPACFLTPRKYLFLTGKQVTPTFQNHDHPVGAWFCYMHVERPSRKRWSFAMFRLGFLYFFFFGVGSYSYIVAKSFFRKSLLSTLSTNSISFAPAYGDSYDAFGISEIADGTGFTSNLLS